MSHLFGLENAGQATRRTELTGQRYLSLIQDPDSGRTYVLRHALDSSEGLEIPDGTEFWEYRSFDQGQRAYEQLLGEAQSTGQVVDTESAEDLGDLETQGAEMRDRYSDQDEDKLANVELEDS